MLPRTVVLIFVYDTWLVKMLKFIVHERVSSIDKDET